MKHILKVASLGNLPDTRPLIAMNDDGDLKWLAEVAPSIEMVDLGLSSGILWAKYNIGATGGDTVESWYGNYYAWGITETKSDYSWETYKYANGVYSSSNKKVFTKYIPSNKPEYWNGEGDPDNKIVLESADDVTTQTYGSSYRMPTKSEIEELMKLPNKWVTDYNSITGLNGRVFTGANGNTLFIPAAGYFNGSAHYNAGSKCYLWPSSLNSSYPGSALNLYFNSDYIGLSNGDRCFGFSVRAVRTAN